MTVASVFILPNFPIFSWYILSMARIRQRGRGESNLSKEELWRIVDFSLDLYVQQPPETFGDRTQLDAKVVSELKNTGLSSPKLDKGAGFAIIAGDAVEEARKAASPEEGMEGFLTREQIGPANPHIRFYKEVYQRALKKQQERNLSLMLRQRLFPLT